MNTDYERPHPQPPKPMPTPYPRGPSYYTCQNDIQLTGNINIQRVFDLASSQQTTLANLLNSRSPSPVSSSSPHSVCVSNSLQSSYRAIRAHRISIRIEPLSSICASASTSRLSHSDRNRTWNGLECVFTVQDAMSTTSTNHPGRYQASEDNQRSEASRWPKSLSVCI